jgi:hypothetical protein
LFTIKAVRYGFNFQGDIIWRFYELLWLPPQFGRISGYFPCPVSDRISGKANPVPQTGCTVYQKRPDYPASRISGASLLQTATFENLRLTADFERRLQFEEDGLGEEELP